MTKKEKFINEVEDLLKTGIPLSSDSMDFFNSLKITGDNGKVAFTQNGKAVLRFIQENVDNYGNLFKAKDIGEGMGVSSRTVSGAMRKLVTDGYVERLGENPVVYSLTEKGKNINLDEA